MRDGERAFRARFGSAPHASVCVPGRVNLIGEHIDYCGLPVLPMALQRRLEMHFNRRDDRIIRVARTDAVDQREFPIVDPLPPFAPGDWGNYIKAAIADLAPELPGARGFDALIESDLPQSAGLSSSSAVVVAAALAFLSVNGSTVDRIELAARLARAERYVGVHGGGMDQAILLLARKGYAVRIDFDPLRARPVRVPEDWAFVIAHSLVDAKKSGGAREGYNTRRRQAEAARAMIARTLGEPLDSYPALIQRWGLARLRAAADGLSNPVLRDRFIHVVTEADRVDRAVRSLEQSDPRTFGSLMAESHESLRSLYDVSHPGLDRLVELCSRAGAFGARLTGAGFGGCVVALTTRPAAAALQDDLERKFYQPNGVRAGELRNRLFTALPSAGATLPA